MATVFEIRIRYGDAVYAGQAAAAAFRLLDRIESELNRFSPNSDIAKLNASQPGETLQLGPHAFACLQRAFQLNAATQGALDISIGCLKEHFQQSNWWQKLWPSRKMMGMENIRLLDDHGKIMVTSPVQVDLGGIGKGYAVDCLLEHLHEWDIDDVLISGGASSVAARGGYWPVTLRHPQRPSEVLASLQLHNQAMGASGLEKGAHIINPRTQQPARGVLATWVIAADATTADAFSTAFMILSQKEAQRVLSAHPQLMVLIIYKKKSTEMIYRYNLHNYNHSTPTASSESS